MPRDEQNVLTSIAAAVGGKSPIHTTVVGVGVGGPRDAYAYACACRL